MEAFGIYEEISVPELTYDEIVERRKNRIFEKENENELKQIKEVKKKKKIERKSACYL